MKKIKGIVITAAATSMMLTGCGFGNDSDKAAFYEEPETDFEFLGISPLSAQLSEKEKAVYEALYDGVTQLEEEIRLPYKIDAETYTRLYSLLEKQEPELFYLSDAYYIADEIEMARIDYRIQDEALIESMKLELETKREIILSQIPTGADDYEKLLWIHDYIIENCTYEVTAGGASAYECLLEGTAHCEGYTKAFAYLARELGYECVLVTGIDHTEVNHAWNQVKIGSKWYNVDVTWDDTDDEYTQRHTYFLRSDKIFDTQHFADKENFTDFECGSEQNNYYKRNDLVIAVDDDAKRILSRELAAGANKLELGFTDASVYEEFYTKYLENWELFEIAKSLGYPVEEITLTVQSHEDELCMEIYLEPSV